MRSKIIVGFWLIVWVFFFFETAYHYAALADLELYTKLNSNSQRSASLCLLSVDIKNYHKPFIFVYQIFLIFMNYFNFHSNLNYYHYQIFNVYMCKTLVLDLVFNVIVCIFSCSYTLKTYFSYYDFYNIAWYLIGSASSLSCSKLS